MATRIIAFSPDGTALTALDGHHGSELAARWAALVVEQLAAQGVDAMVVEVEPEQGGDAARSDMIGSLHRLRAETRRTPDGRRELLGLLRLSDAPDARAAVAATPERVRCGLRLVCAPGEWLTPLRPVRVARGRLSGGGTPAAARHARRAERAAQRGSAV